MTHQCKNRGGGEVPSAHEETPEKAKHVIIGHVFLFAVFRMLGTVNMVSQFVIQDLGEQEAPDKRFHQSLLKTP